MWEAQPVASPYRLEQRNVRASVFARWGSGRLDRKRPSRPRQRERGSRGLTGMQSSDGIPLACTSERALRMPPSKSKRARARLIRCALSRPGPAGCSCCTTSAGDTSLSSFPPPVLRHDSVHRVARQVAVLTTYRAPGGQPVQQLLFSKPCHVATESCIALHRHLRGWSPPPSASSHPDWICTSPPQYRVMPACPPPLPLPLSVALRSSPLLPPPASPYSPLRPPGSPSTEHAFALDLPRSLDSISVSVGAFPTASSAPSPIPIMLQAVTERPWPI